MDPSTRSPLESFTDVLKQLELNVSRQQTFYLMSTRPYELSTDEVVVLMDKAIRCNTTLRTLDLGYSRIEDEHVIKISEFLSNNVTLTSLKLNHNILTDKGVPCIFNLITNTMTSLVYLDLSNNFINWEYGISHLKYHLPQFKSLKTLVLNGSNSICNIMEDIGLLLKENTTLRHLYLQCCNISNSDLDTLYFNCPRDIKLKTLQLTQNYISLSGYQKLHDYFFHNTNLIGLNNSMNPNMHISLLSHNIFKQIDNLNERNRNNKSLKKVTLLELLWGITEDRTNKHLLVY